MLYGDSGEFQTLVQSLGMTHPTGYANYLILGWIFSNLPLGNPAWEVNLFSALCAAITLASVYLIISLLTGSRLAALTASIILAVNPLFWYFSIIAELYIPASAFISLIFLFLLLWRHTERLFWLAAAGLLGGITPGIHGLAALTAPAVLVYLISVTFVSGINLMYSKKRIWGIALSGVAVGLALTLGAFFFIDSQNPPAGYYNATVLTSMDYLGLEPSDFDSPFDRFKFIKFGEQFQAKMFDRSILFSHIISYLKWIIEGFGVPFMILISLGIFYLIIQSRPEGYLLLLGWVLQMFFIIFYKIPDIVSFFPPTYISLAVFAGFGLWFLVKTLKFVFQHFRLVKWASPSANILVIFILIVTILPRSDNLLQAWQERALIFMQDKPFVRSTYQMENPDAAYTKAKSIVDAVEDDAIVFVGWRELFPCYYVAIKEGRNEIDFHQIFLQKGSDELSQSAIDYIAGNLGARPIYLEDSTDVSKMLRFDLQAIERGGVTLNQVTGLNP